MPMPGCPACGKQLGWKECSTFWNPWDSPCPHCKARLEASRHQKYLVYAMVPVGAFLAALPLLLEAHGVWEKRQSIAFFAIVVPCMIGGVLVTWTRTTFKVRHRQKDSPG